MKCPNSLNKADLKFFRRFPDRLHRIRVAGHDEIEEARQKGVLTAPIPKGYRAHVGLKYDTRGGVHRSIGALAEGTDCDASERGARAAYYALVVQDDAHLITLADSAGA